MQICAGRGWLAVTAVFVTFTVANLEALSLIF